VAIVSLMVSAALTYTIMCLLGPAIGFALSLPAVCGVIVAIGITADSFIVFFERIRDGLREGRSLEPAVARGWPRARRTILVSDFVSFLAPPCCTWSRWHRPGLRLHPGLTTVLDVAVVFLFTKPLMTILAAGRSSPKATGCPASTEDPRRAGPAAPRPPYARHRDEGSLMSKLGNLGHKLHRGEISYDFVGKRMIWYGCRS